MKIFFFLLILCVSFKICIAQVDSLSSENKPNIYYNSSIDRRNQKIDEQFQFDDTGCFNNSIRFQRDFNLLLQQFSLLRTNHYSNFDNKIGIAKNESYLSYFNEMIPKSNPIFSIQYALFYGLYSDNNKLLKRRNCIP